MSDTISSSNPITQSQDAFQTLAPGLLLAAAVSILGTWLAPHMPSALPLPAMVLALVIGMALNGSAQHPLFKPGTRFCVKTLLRWAVALLGLRVAFGDIIDLGPAVAALVVFSMIATLGSALALARLFGQTPMFATLAGAATAVCGASATLATSTVVPPYAEKERDIAFVVVGVNLLATAAMLLYPLIGYMVGLDDQAIGVLLGATIHDVAQVVGAGYAISDEAGAAAVVVKLSRVFLLLPIVLFIGWAFVRTQGRQGKAKVPMPIFAFVFLALCIVNSIASEIPALLPIYEPIKVMFVGLSTWGLLLAIAALGLETSFRSFMVLGWKHVATLIGTALVILFIVAFGLVLIG